MDGKHWREHFTKDPKVIEFQETKNTEKYIELYDKKRDAVVQLYNDRYLVKVGKGKFDKLNNGKIHRSHGREVHRRVQKELNALREPGNRSSG